MIRDHWAEVPAFCWRVAPLFVAVVTALMPTPLGCTLTSIDTLPLSCCSPVVFLCAQKKWRKCSFHFLKTWLFPCSGRSHSIPVSYEQPERRLIVNLPLFPPVGFGEMFVVYFATLADFLSVNVSVKASGSSLWFKVEQTNNNSQTAMCPGVLRSLAAVYERIRRKRPSAVVERFCLDSF